MKIPQFGSQVAIRDSTASDGLRATGSDRAWRDAPAGLWRTRATATLALIALAGGCATSNLHLVQSPDAVTIGSDSAQPAVTYRLRPPPGSGLVIESGGYFHPLTTPRGVVVTDFAPSDHPHHRGVFLGWVEMHGVRDADFWGWGEHAPIKGRRVVNRSIHPTRSVSGRSFEAINDWQADDTVMIEEKLTATFLPRRDFYVLDLSYELTPKSDILLSRWAFSGFCLRTRKEGAIEYFSPEGIVTLPNPSHLKAETDWPDAPWYACTVRLSDGVTIGVAVINHPANPPTLWHNHREVRMINPCIVAPGAVRLKSGEPLKLRYRVVTFDGPPPTRQLTRLALEWKGT